MVACILRPGERETILVHTTSPKTASLTERPSAVSFDAMGRDLPQERAPFVTSPQHEECRLPDE